MAVAYRVLGRTGVKVHPLCLGTMNFGGRTDAAEAGKILDTYKEVGGNFVDTANVYNDGRSESIIGDWMKSRDRMQRGTPFADNGLTLHVGLDLNVDAGVQVNAVADGTIIYQRQQN